MALENDDLNLRRTQREKLRQERLAKQRKLKMGLLAGAVALVLCAVLIFVLTRQSAGDPGQDTPETTDTLQADVAPETTAQDRTTVIHLAAAGDLCVTDDTVASGGSTYDYTRTFMDVLPLLADADLTVMNFEGNLCGAPYGSSRASAPQSMAEALAAAGVDLVQMANSCSISNGLKGLQTTLNNLRAAGMEPLGAWATGAEFESSGGYTIREVQGVRIAFVAFTKGMDSLGLPPGSEDCVNLLYEDYTSNYQDIDYDGIRGVLRAAAAEAPDLTVAMVHWGSEFNELISDTQEDILELLYAEGADVVLGTHPHLLQQMKLDTENNTFVAWSLGDFFSDGQRGGSDYSVVVNLEITKDHVTGTTTITGFSYTPIFNLVTEDGMRLVRMEEAIAAYEMGNIERISQEEYEDMVYAMKRIPQRISPEE